MGSSSGNRFGFRHMFPMSLFVESIANAGIRDSFGIVQLSGKTGEKRKHCKVSRKELEARRWECYISFISPAVMMKAGMVGHGYDVFVDDIYSCYRRWLV